MKKTSKIALSTIILTIILSIFICNNIKVYAADKLSINAKSALIVERNTGKVIYEKDSNTQNYPASVTKILTAIIVIENCKLTDKVTVSKEAISQVPSEYIVVPLVPGEEITVEDLLYALMLKSANDAAYALAEHVGGSVEGFADIMNKKANEIGCKNSHFVNPNGIHNNDHYTSAYDLYLISNYAMKNETFAKIVSTYQYTLHSTNKHPSSNSVMTNTNQFINPGSGFYNKIVKGIKTGTTNQAGNCLITDSEKDGLEFITVVLGADTSNSKFSETKKMIDYSFNNYELAKVQEKGNVITSVQIDKATEETKDLKLAIDDDVIAMKNVEIKLDEIQPEINISSELVAPIKAGQEIGTVKYSIDGLEYSAKLVAVNDVVKRTYYKEIGIAISVALVLIVFIGMILKKSKKYKKRKRRKELKV